jgi:hypothetical protein
MDTHWAALKWTDLKTTDDKLEWLHANIELLKAALRQHSVELDQSQRGLNDRIVKLEQAINPAKN